MRSLLAVTVVMALALAGCGGDKSGGGSGVPEKRPADFAGFFRHADGSVPPPHHVEWTLTLKRDGKGELAFVPDYPAGGVPRFRASFDLDPAALDRLYESLREEGLLDGDVKRGEPTEAPTGGESDSANLTFAGGTINIPSFDDSGSSPLEPVRKDIEGIVPERVWNDMERRRAAYARKRGY